MSSHKVKSGTRSQDYKNHNVVSRHLFCADCGRALNLWDKYQITDMTIFPAEEKNVCKDCYKNNKN